MIQGSAAATQNDGLQFNIETSSTATTMSPRNVLESVRQYMTALELMTRQPGWDLERGMPVSTQAWRSARVFLEKSFDEVPALQVPDISASGDGYVHFVWFSRGRRAVVEVSDSRAHWTVLTDGEAHVEENVDLRGIFDKLRRFVRGE